MTSEEITVERFEHKHPDMRVLESYNDVGEGLISYVPRGAMVVDGIVYGPPMSIVDGEIVYYDDRAALCPDPMFSIKDQGLSYRGEILTTPFGDTG